MKRSVILLFVLIIFLFPLISAVEINILNPDEEFSSGETLIAKVSGNFITSVTKENIFFYKGPIIDSNFQVSLDYDVIKIGNDFYIYAILLDKTEGNYSVTVENAQYMKGTDISEDMIIKNFSINTQTADFYVKPGVIDATGDFFIEAQNLNENSITIDVNTEANNSGEREIFVEGAKTFSLPLESGDKDKINFQLGAGGIGIRTIELKTANTVYQVPVSTTSASEGGISGISSLSFEPAELNFSLPINSVTKKTIYLSNSENQNFTNISLSLSDSLSGFVTLSKTSIETLNAHSYEVIELSLFSSNETKIEGELNAQIGDTIISSSVYLQFMTNYVPANETQYSTKTCAELNGTLYDTQTSKCDKEPIHAKDNICCLGVVTKIASDNTGKIIAGIIIALVVAGLVWFYFAKFRKTKRKPLNLMLQRREPLPMLSRPVQPPVAREPVVKIVEKPVIREVEKKVFVDRPVIKEVEKIVEKPVEVEKKVFVERPKEHVPKYTGSSNTGIYHLSTCKFSKLIEKKYKIQKDSAEYFTKNKYQRCKMCLGRGKNN